MTPAINARLTALLAALLALVLLLLTTAYETWQRAADYTAASYRAEIATLKSDHATSLAAQERASRQRLLEATDRANQLAARLDDEKAAHARLAVQLKSRSPNVTRTYKPALSGPSLPVPRTVFTVGFLRVFNDAIGADSLPEPFAAAAAALPAGQADALDALDSGLTQQDILDYVTGYGQQCKDTAAQLNKLIDHYEASRHAP